LMLRRSAVVLTLVPLVAIAEAGRLARVVMTELTLFNAATIAEALLVLTAASSAVTAATWSFAFAITHAL
jgi:hypothetical protein